VRCDLAVHHLEERGGGCRLGEAKMKNFLKLGEGMNVIPLLLAMQQRPELWNQHKLRTTHAGTPHAQVDDIWLRFNDVTPLDGVEDTIENRQRFLDQHESICYPAWHVLPEAQLVVHNLNNLVKGFRIGRVLLTRLAPGKRIEKHVDSGDHARYYERFHVVLQASPGCLFRAGDETVQMRTGEAWWFQNQAEHEVVNNSTDDRIHLIVDIHTGRSLP
jgi:hypothetical protein